MRQQLLALGGGQRLFLFGRHLAGGDPVADAREQPRRGGRVVEHGLQVDIALVRIGVVARKARALDRRLHRAEQRSLGGGARRGREHRRNRRDDRGDDVRVTHAAHSIAAVTVR